MMCAHRLSRLAAMATVLVLFATTSLSADSAVEIVLPAGPPETFEPGVTVSFSVLISDGTEMYVPGTATLHYRYYGGAFQSSPLIWLGGNQHRAVLPPAGCSAAPEYYISAEGSGGTVVTEPVDAPTTLFTSEVGGLVVLFADDFESSQGWEAVNLGATAGEWDRGVPVNDPDWDYDPAADYDGSGQCYLTGNELGNSDVDGGAVRLISPIMDLSSGRVTISYAYFLRLTGAGPDHLLVEISSNGETGPWMPIADHNTDGGLEWRSSTITQEDLNAAGVVLTTQMQLRFTTNDADPQTINETALDAVLVTSFGCSPVSGACCQPDGTCAVVETWADCDESWSGEGTTCDPNPCPQPCALAADVNSDGLVNAADIKAFIDCLLSGDAPAGNCACGDFTGNQVSDLDDVRWFVHLLLRGESAHSLDTFCSTGQITLRVFENVLYAGQAAFEETVDLVAPPGGEAGMIRMAPPYADCYDGSECVEDCPEIDTELVDLHLTGSGSMLGNLTLQTRADAASVGGLCCVDANAEGAFLSGDGYVNLFARIDLPAYGLTLSTRQTPVRLQAEGIEALPPMGADFTMAADGSGLCSQPAAPAVVPLFATGGSEQIGELVRMTHQVGCPAATGGCCDMFAQCRITTEAECAEAGDGYLGDLTTCADDPCCRVLLNMSSLINLGQPTTASAVGLPFGGACEWYVDYEGAGRVSLDPVGDCTATVQGTALSSAPNDVTVRVVYTTLGGHSCEASVQATVGVLRLKQLIFAGSGLRNVARDSSGSAYGSPQWLDLNNDGDASDLNEQRFPVAYSRNGPVAVRDVRFTVAPTFLVSGSVPVRGTGPDGDIFMGTGVLSGSEIIVSATLTASDPLPNTVKFYNPYNILWEVALDGEHYSYAGISDHRVYVTLNTPTASPLYETCLELACTGADGTDTAAAAVAGIWAEFLDCDVRRKPIDGYNNPDGIRMGYWRPIPGVTQSLSGMLASPIGNGSCVAWSYLLQSCIQTQGISGATISQITVNTTVCPGASGFLVQSWAFGANIRGGANGICESTLLGDDVAIVALGNGFPFTTCVTKGSDGVLNTVPAGDDILAGDEINTGPNGICETAKVGNDIQVIPVGNGEPGELCILPGPNGAINSTLGGDDTYVVGSPGGGTYPYTIGSSASNLPGIPGEDNPEPPEAFYNHFIVKYGGQVYDPSYGAGPYPSENAHENAAIHGIRSGSSAKTNNPQIQELYYN